MNRLSYQTLKEQNYPGYLLEHAPERILQFGEGNFLRAFVDHFIDILNEKAGFDAKVVVCQPSSPNPAASDRINTQDGLYTLLLRGCQDGQAQTQTRVVSCISRCLNAQRDYEQLMDCAANPELRFLVSNTTEAGIVYDPACQFTDTPASSFPGKLTQFLYRRFQKFGMQNGKGFLIFSCELIDNNGKELENCVLRYADQWKLGTAFTDWVREENLFCSTLVDRIVTGYPREEADAICRQLGYEDQLLDTGEPFGFWVIEGPQSILEEFPVHKTDLPVLITDNHKPYKQRKVRILNGSHTSFVLGAYLSGQNIVRDCMHDPVIREFLHRTVYDEIIPTLDLPEDDLLAFASAVSDRFCNPFIDHALLSIALNSTAKWKARVLPSLKEYIARKDRLPECLTASFAFYIAFYHGHTRTGDGLLASRSGNDYTIKDDPKVLDFFYEHRTDSADALVHAVCSRADFWGEDLLALPGFEQAVCQDLSHIWECGAYAVMEALTASAPALPPNMP